MNTNLYTNHIGAIEDLIIDDKGEGIITTEQALGDDFWQDLNDAKEDFSFRLNGMTSVASVPEALANKWIREGFDIWSAPANEIIRKLRIDGYERFIISGDKTFDH